MAETCTKKTDEPTLKTDFWRLIFFGSLQYSSHDCTFLFIEVSQFVTLGMGKPPIRMAPPTPCFPSRSEVGGHRPLRESVIRIVTRIA